MHTTSQLLLLARLLQDLGTRYRYLKISRKSCCTGTQVYENTLWKGTLYGGHLLKKGSRQMLMPWIAYTAHLLVATKLQDLLDMLKVPYMEGSLPNVQQDVLDTGMSEFQIECRRYQTLVVSSQPTLLHMSRTTKSVKFSS